MHQTESTLTTADGLQLFTINWLPDAPPSAHVLLLHGLGEHAGRYPHVAQYLNQRGYGVWSFDQRGHGRSPGEPRAYFDSLEQAGNDAALRLQEVQKAIGGQPLFLYGHSLGTLVSLTLLLKHQAAFKGAVLTGTPLAVESVQPKPLVLAAQLLNSLTPKAAITPPLPTSTLSRDEQVCRAYETDPLVYHGKVSVRMGHNILMGSRAIRARLGELKLPLLLLHGADDKLCPPLGSQYLYDGAGSNDKTHRTFPGMRHEIHNEIGQAEVFDQVGAWFDAHR